MKSKNSCKDIVELKHKHIWCNKLNIRLLKVPTKIIFATVGVVSIVWFLIRVIPKPSRAAYPCMRIAFPFMSSFVIWMVSLLTSIFAFRKVKRHFNQGRIITGFLLVMVGLLAFFLSNMNSPRTTNASIVQWYTANSPIGIARGIHPGRVAWIHNPEMTSWDGESGFWWEDSVNDQTQYDKTMQAALICLTGLKSENLAWQAIFEYYNKQKYGVSKAYNSDEKIAIKINQNNTSSHENNNEINTSPQLLLSLLKSLINNARVPQQNITVFDASRFITDNIFGKCHSQFPDVIFVDHSGENGRAKSAYVEDAIPYSMDNGKLAKGLAQCLMDADYIINMAILKGHVGQGVTLCAKNFYGATSIHSDWRKNAHDNFDQNRDGSPRYMTFTDFLGHKDLGEKTLIFMIDAVYANKFVNGPPSFKWQMTPFNNDWPSSLFISQDGVAIDAVGIDFLLSEFPDAPDMQYCDAYLIESALADNPPSGTKYDPEIDGSVLKSLGVLEHWNNPIDKKYSRNLARENGIELVYTRIN